MRTRTSWPGFGAVLTLLVLGGCASHVREATPPPSPLELLSAGPLELPAGCEPEDGTVYRTGFVVEGDGGVTQPTSQSGEGCVQRSLRTWVTSFRYAPIGAAMPVVIDWIAVTASRGG